MEHWPPDAHSRDVLAARDEHAGFGEEHRSFRTLIIGESNPYGSSPDFALYPDPPHSAGGRLPSILGISDEEQKATWRTNLCLGSWDNVEASTKLKRLMKLGEGQPWNRYVLLGARPRKAFDLLHLPHKTMQAGRDCWLIALLDRPDVQVLAMPHPSGRCRLWNIPGVQESVAELFNNLHGKFLT